MSVEVLPVGQKCNLKCTYCYEESMRQAEGVVKNNLKAMLRQLKKQGKHFTVFGGEPLLTPLHDLEILFKAGLKWYGKNGVQTNGTILTEKHIELFKKYKVHVGISFDGPGELNESRPYRKGMSSATVTDQNIRRLLREKVSCSLIVTLSRSNAVGERLDKLIAWLQDMGHLGIRSARLHFLELDNPGTGPKLRLGDSENATAVVRITEEVRSIDFDLLKEMKKSLQGDTKTISCVWRGCDPYNTSAVIGVDYDGSLSNCGRANKTGINYRKSETTGNERLRALYRTPHEGGGCQGCRFFIACRGECPGTGIDGDWRNRTEHCGTLLILFERLEKELVAEGKVPLSLAENREDMEKLLLVKGSIISNHVNWHGNVPHQNCYMVPVRGSK